MTALTAPAPERNKGPILAVLRQVLPATGLVLEIASGTGQHVVHFAQALPDLLWQPSDPEPEMRASIDAWVQSTGVQNVRPALPLDVQERPWPVTSVAAVVCINMVHISPWVATLSLMAGAAHILGPGGVLYLYGPYRQDGRHTAPSNEVFDIQLRASNAEWGVRDLEAVVQVAADNGFALDEIVPMPANNLSVVFRRAAGS